MRNTLLVLAALILALGCVSEDPPDGGSDCARAAGDFRDFVSANDSCSSASECTVVGDCGPNADFTAVRREAGAEAMRLMRLRCPGAWDGPMFVATCTEGRCGTMIAGGYCGMIAFDAGADAGPDGSTDAGTDGST